jgi:hypothetical protein
LKLDLAPLPLNEIGNLIEPMLLVSAERRAQADAVRACAALSLLAKTMRPSDWLRRTAQAGGALSTTWIGDVADAALALADALAMEREAFQEALETDRDTRHRLDGAVCGLLIAAQDEERQQRAVAAAATLDLDGLRAKLWGAGLTDSEVAGIVANREDGKASEQTRREALMAVDRALERGAVLGAYLADPLRDISRLPSELADALEVRARWDMQRAADSVAQTKRYAAALTRQSMPGSKAANAAGGA